jgi:hypothetical protein
MASSHEQAVAAKTKAVSNLKLQMPPGVINSVGVGYDSNEWIVVLGVTPNLPLELIPEAIDGVRTKVEFQGPAVAASVISSLKSHV